MSRIPINHEAIARYQQVRDSNARYSIKDESSSYHFFNNGFSDEDASSSTTRTATLPMSPRSPTRPRVSKYHGDHNMKSPMQKSPAASVDRSLRSNEWVGGHSPYGFKKPKRTWKLKNPADEIYLKKL